MLVYTIELCYGTCNLAKNCFLSYLKEKSNDVGQVGDYRWGVINHKQCKFSLGVCMHACRYEVLTWKPLTYSYMLLYRIIWLISACAYSGKRNDSMRLIKDMRLYGT